MGKLSYRFEMLRRIRFLRATPKAWNYVKYRCLPRGTRMPLGQYTPQIASLHLTMRCNLNCGYCCAAKILDRNKGTWHESDMDLEKTKRIFSNPLFANCMLVDLLGGEPLLIKDFDQIVAYLTEHGHLTNTSTNGLLLAARVADLKRAGISRINVSFYDANRSILERDLENINQIFPVHASIVLLRSEVEQKQAKLLETVRFIHDAGCCSLRFFMYRPMGVDPKPDEIIEASNPGYADFRRQVDKMFPGFCLWPAEIPAGPVKKRCRQLWQRINVDGLGNIVICCGTDMILKGADSNVFRDDPGLVFNHPVLVAMRKQLLDPECEPPEICKTCNLLGDPGW